MGRVSVTRIAGMAALAATVLVSVVPAGAQEVAPSPEAAAAAGPTRCTQLQVEARVYRFFGVTSQALSAGGERLVYDSWALVGTYYVPDDERVHLYDAITRSRSDLTSPLYGEALYPRISADGGTVAFMAQPTGSAGERDEARRPAAHATGAESEEIFYWREDDEIFLYDVASGTARQVSPAGDGIESTLVGLSADGGRVLYRTETDYDVFGTEGPWDLRVYDAHQDETIDVGSDLGPWGAALSPDGTTVAFSSRADLLGSNDDGNVEVYLLDLDASQLEQVTDTAAGAENRVGGFTLDGTAIELSSPADLAGGGVTGASRGYLYDLVSRTFRLRADLGPPGALSEDGSHIAVSSRDDPVGTNPDRTFEYALHDVASGTDTVVTEQQDGGDFLGYRDIAPDGGAVAYTVGARQPLRSNNRVVLATGCDPAPRPDARVAVEGGPSVGDDVYWARPSARQKQVVVAPPRSTTRFTVELQNDRAATDVFRVDGDSVPVAGYRIRYLRGDDDVTQQVEAGTYFTGAVAAGGSVVLTVEVTAAGRRATGPNVVVDLTARSWTNLIARDAVRAKVRLSP